MEEIDLHETEARYHELKVSIDASPFGNYLYERIDKPDKIGIRILSEIPKSKFDEMVTSLPDNVRVFSNRTGTVGTNLIGTSDGVVESTVFSSVRCVNPAFYLE